MGTGAMVARASDLPYLIVGVVLGSIVLIIVTFIPFCLWRAWSKQSELTPQHRGEGGRDVSQPTTQASAQAGPDSSAPPPWKLPGSGGPKGPTETVDI